MIPFQFLLLYFLGWTPLHEAAMHYGDGTQNILELLVSNGTDVNARANNGSTPLHDAMMFLPEECIKYLVIIFFLSLVHHFKNSANIIGFSFLHFLKNKNVVNFFRSLKGLIQTLLIMKGKLQDLWYLWERRQCLI